MELLANGWVSMAIGAVVYLWGLAGLTRQPVDFPAPELLAPAEAAAFVVDDMAEAAVSGPWQSAERVSAAERSKRLPDTIGGVSIEEIRRQHRGEVGE